MIVGLGTAGFLPLAARAQQTQKMARIGFISDRARPMPFESSDLAGFLNGMRDLGYIEGKNFAMEWRFAEGRYERFPAFAAELVQLNVDVIVVASPTAIRAVQQATKTISIVFSGSADPVGNGFVASLAHPGGNITGQATSVDDAAPKLLEYMRMLMPGLSNVGVLTMRDSPNNGPILKSLRSTADRLQISLVLAEAREASDIAPVFAAWRRQDIGAVLVVPEALFTANRQMIADLAFANRLPSLFAQREHVAAGGLMSYGENLAEFYYRSAAYVDKILKGAKPADLPVEQPVRFYLILNLKTAAALGLEVPPMLLAIADEVIE